jgi:hypothetical protein
VIDLFNTPTPAMDFIVYWLTLATSIGLVLVVLAFIITVPIFLIARALKK